MSVTMKIPAAADFLWKNVVIGADLDAVEYAHSNNFFLIKNRMPRHHSYEGIENVWAEKCYQLYVLGLSPFMDKAASIRVFPDKKLIKIFTQKDVFTILYEKLRLFDTENVSGVTIQRKLKHYRVVDWFDCKGLHSLSFDEVKTGHKFVNRVKFFKTLRIDGDQKYLDLLCESFLSEEQLKSFDCSDTMVRLKAAGLLKKHCGREIEMRLWKRDVYPVYQMANNQTIY